MRHFVDDHGPEKYESSEGGPGRRMAEGRRAGDENDGRGQYDGSERRRPEQQRYRPHSDRPSTADDGSSGGAEAGAGVGFSGRRHGQHLAEFV